MRMRLLTVMTFLEGEDGWASASDRGRLVM